MVLDLIGKCTIAKIGHREKLAKVNQLRLFS